MSITHTDEQNKLPPHNADNPDARSLVRAELARIGERFEAADRRAKRAATMEDREAAEAERQEVAGDSWALGTQLADFLLLLIRYALRHQPAALTMYLTEALRPELEPMAAALARQEVGR